MDYALATPWDARALYKKREFMATTTIDKLDISVYNGYAERTRAIEQTNKQLRLDQASYIPPQIQVLDINPKQSELFYLFGYAPPMTWALFYPPPKFRLIRRSPFSYRVIPSLGSYGEQEEAELKLDNIPCTTQEEVNEKALIKACFKEIEKLNKWITFVWVRVGQFLQG